jgi:hypothetical protein
MSDAAADEGAVNPPQSTTRALVCEECGTVWRRGWERWRLKVIFEESPPLCVLYCPACHAYEFER